MPRLKMLSGVREAREREDFEVSAEARNPSAAAQL
jgi:hypothetical protein